MEWFPSRGINRWLDGNGLLKTDARSMEDKMAAEAFGGAGNYGWDPLQFFCDSVASNSSFVSSFLPSFLPSLPFLLHSGCELQISSSATSAQLLFGRWPRLGVCRQLNSLDEHKTTRYWAKDPNNPSDRTTRMNGEIEESSSFSWDKIKCSRIA